MKKKYKNLFVILASFSYLCLLIISQTSLALVNTAVDDELARLMNNIHTMQASFEQSLINQHGSHIGTKTIGKMALERPGKFRWEITQPNNQLLIINKDKMFLYDPDLSQLTKRKVNINQPGNPAMLLSSCVKSLQQSFQILKLKKSGREVWFKLTPKKQKIQEDGYQWIKIGFVDGKLSTMYIFDNLEQTSFISFSRIILNAKIPVEKFRFIPPPNTEVFNAE
jgi:outer membrane lipoprotein carrier protein